MSKEEFQKSNKNLNNPVIKKDPVEKLGDIIDKMMSGRKNNKNDSNKNSSEVWHKRNIEYEKLKKKAEKEGDFKMVRHYEVSIDQAKRMEIESLNKEGNVEKGQELLRVYDEVKNNKEIVETAGANEKQNKKVKEAGDNFIKGVETASQEYEKELELLPIAGGNGSEEFLDKENKKEEKIDKVDETKIESENPQETLSRLNKEYQNEEVEQQEKPDKENESNKKGDLKTSVEIAMEKSEEITKEKQENKEDSNKKTEKEEKLEKEAAEIKEELEKMPSKEREKIWQGWRNIGFVVREQKSSGLASLCEWFAKGKNEDKTFNRFLKGLAVGYRKDEKIAKSQIKSKSQIKEMGLTSRQMRKFQNAGYLSGEALKWGRNVGDIMGWTAGSPLRFWMMVAQFFARGATAAKEARLMNKKVIETTRIDDINQAADEAWGIYEKAKSLSPDGKVSKETLEKAYEDNLPQDLLNRLKESEPYAASGILQQIFRKHIELSVKYGGKINQRAFKERLKDYDRMLTQWGEVDAAAMTARYVEMAGKGAIAGLSIQTGYLLMKNLPNIIHNLSSYWEEGAVELKFGKGEINEGLEEVKKYFGASDTEKSGIQEIPSAAGPKDEVMQRAEEALKNSKEVLGRADEVLKQTDEVLKHAEEAAAGLENLEIADDQMNSVWKMSERQLETRGFFNELTGTSDEILAKKTYLIDAIKDKIAANPSVFGLEDVDELKSGQSVDFGEIFKDEKIFKEVLLTKAGKLSSSEIASILNHNKNIAEFHKLHPDFSINSENVDEIGAGQGEKLLKKAVETSVATEGSAIAEKMTELEKAGISEEDIRHLTKEDIAELTPEQIEEAGEYGAKTKALGKLGISEKDIAELTPEDVKALTPEQIKEVGSYENKTQTLEKIGISGKDIAKLNLEDIKALTPGQVKEILLEKTGLTQGEYGAVKNIQVGEFLDKIPSRAEAWKLYQEGELPRIPHEGVLGAIEYGRQIKLAEIIRSFDPQDARRDLTIDKFLNSLVEEPVPPEIKLPSTEELQTISLKAEALRQAGVSKETLAEFTSEEIKALTPEQIKEAGEYAQKVQTLEKAGVASEDISKLTPEDVKTLTPEQIEEIKPEHIEEFEKAEKIAELEKADVSKEDIEQLTEKDIQMLTSKQIEDLPELEKKTQMLREAGISDENISKLSVKDIENMTKEQIEQIRIETLEAPSDINLTNGFSYKGEEGNFNIHFNYDAKGDVVGYALDAKTVAGGNLKLQDSVLKENWQETFDKNKGFFRLNSLDRTRFQNQATEIGEIKKIIDSMKEKGLSGKKEYEFLLKIMNNRISNLENRHGDIFK